MGKQIELSERMQAIAGMVTDGLSVCDVGCDHGFISIYLVEQGISPRVIAMDVNQGPLQAAREHIVSRGLEEQIELRLSDGVDRLRKKEAEAVICAGMGGRLMRRILEEGWDKISSVQELILQPQSEIMEFREYLYEKGCLISEEEMVLEDGKYYVVIKALPGKGTNRKASRAEYTYGPVLLKKRHPVLHSFLEKEEQQYRKILESLAMGNARREARRLEIQRLLDETKEALSFFDRG